MLLNYSVCQNILVVHSSFFDMATLLNPQRGIDFIYSPDYSILGAHNLDTAQIGPDSESNSVEFFDPNQYQQVLNSTYLSGGTLSGDEIKNNLRSWNGYGSFKDKYWPPATP